MSKDIDELSERVSYIESTDPPGLVGGSILDRQLRSAYATKGFFYVVDFNGEVWNRCSGSTLGQHADLHRLRFLQTVGPNPAKIHHQIQAEDVAIEALRSRQISALDVANDSNDFQVDLRLLSIL